MIYYTDFLPIPLRKWLPSMTITKHLFMLFYVNVYICISLVTVVYYHAFFSNVPIKYSFVIIVSCHYQVKT